MADGRRIVFGRYEEYGDGSFEHDAFRDVDVGAVFEKRGVERAEGIALGIEIAAEVLFDGSGMLRDRGREAIDDHTLGQFAVGRMCRRKPAIDEHQSRSGSRDEERRERFLRRKFVAVAREMERGFGDRTGIGETPVFVAHGGEAGFRETREPVLAKLFQPREVMARSGLFESAEAFSVFRDQWRGTCHIRLSLPRWLHRSRSLCLPVPRRVQGRRCGLCGR